MKLQSFADESRIFIDTSALLAAAGSSNTLNHFFGDLLRKKEESSSEIYIPSTVIKELLIIKERGNSTDGKAARRALEILSRCMKSNDIIGIVALHSGQTSNIPEGTRFQALRGSPISEPSPTFSEITREFLERQVFSLGGERFVYVLSNDIYVAEAVYRTASDALTPDNTRQIRVYEVVEAGNTCELEYVEPEMAEPTPTPEPVPGTSPEPGVPDGITVVIAPDPDPVIDDRIAIKFEEFEQMLAAARIATLIQLDEDFLTPEPIVRDDEGHIKVPHM